MEWEPLLRQYEESRRSVSRKLESTREEETRQILLGMLGDLTEDIRRIRPNVGREMEVFLSEYGEVLTARQQEVMGLRARGWSLGRIARELGVSKTAVRKSLCLCEKKIRRMEESNEAKGGLS